MQNFTRTCLLYGAELYNLIHEKCSLFKVSLLHFWKIFRLKWETDCTVTIQKENAQDRGLRFEREETLGPESVLAFCSKKRLT